MRAPLTYLVFAACTALAGCSFDPPARPDTAIDATTDAPARPDVRTDVPRPRDVPADVRVDAPKDVVSDQTDQPRDIAPDLQDVPPDEPVVNLAFCDGMQVDLNQDAQHCGGCNIACDPAYGVCNGGTCGCAPSGMKACLPDRKCEDVQISPVHCGDCGTTCTAGAWCKDGTCQCRAGFTRCGGACVDLSVDPANCGQCGNSCEGDACRQGSCRDNNRCPFPEGRCRVSDEDGVACLPESRFDNPLYCREDAFPNRCGQRCRGDQICVKPGFFSPRRCFDVRPALGCTSCANCDACTSDEVCDDDWSPANTAYCRKK